MPASWKEKIEEAKSLIAQVREANNDTKSVGDSGIDSAAKAEENTKKLARARQLGAEAKKDRQAEETSRTEALLAAFDDVKNFNGDGDADLLKNRKGAEKAEEWEAPSTKGVLAIDRQAAEKWYGRKGANALQAADQKVLNEGDSTAGGYLVVPEYHQEMFAEVRRQGNALRQLGWVNVHPTASNKLYIPKGAGSATMAWVAENSPAPSQDQQFGQIGVDIFKAVGIAKLSSEVGEDSDPAALDLAIQELAKLAAILEEQAWLFGTGSGMPKGILSIARGTAATQVSTTNFDSLTTAQQQLDAVLDLQMQVLTNYFSAANGVLISPRRYAFWRKAKDSANNYLFNAPGSFRAPGAARTSVYDGGDILGLPIGISPNMPTTVTDDNSSNTSGAQDRIIVSDWSEAHAFIRRATTIDTNTQSDTAFANGQMHVRLSFRQGFTAERQPKAFAVGEGDGLV